MAQLKVTCLGYDLSDRLGFIMMFACWLNCPVTALARLSKAQEQMYRAINELVQMYTPDELNEFCWSPSNLSWFCWNHPELILLQPGCLDLCTQQLQRLSKGLCRQRNLRTHEQRQHLLRPRAPPKRMLVSRDASWYTVQNVGDCMARVEEKIQEIAASKNLQYPQLTVKFTKPTAAILEPIPCMKDRESEQVYGVICEAGITLLLSRCKQSGRRLFDIGSGVCNVLGTAAMAGIDVAGIERNASFHEIGTELMTKKFNFGMQNIDEGDMFNCRPADVPTIFFLNNEKLQGLHRSIINWLVSSLPLGSQVYTLAQLPLCEIVNGKIGTMYTKGCKAITFTERIARATRPSWNDKEYPFYVYEVHAAGTRVKCVGHVAGLLR
jgi:hypothetical protein